MEEKKYTVALSDGTKIENLILNGNNFISTEKITSDVFENNCSPVVINNGEFDDIHENMELVQITTPVHGEYWFILRDLTAGELNAIKTQSDIEYIAMMTGVEL